MRTFSILKTTLLALVATLILAAGEMNFAQAQESPGRVGLMYGFSVPDSDNVSPYRMFGVAGLAHLTPSYSFGGYYLIADQTEGGGGRVFKHSLHGIQALYHIASGTGDTFFGIRAGLSKVRTEDSGERLIFSPYHHGIVSGYDYKLLPWLSIGFEGSFLLFRTATTPTSTSSVTEEKFNLISFLAGFKINF